MIAEALLACAVNVSPVTVAAIIQVESGGNPISIGVNAAKDKPTVGPQHPSNVAESAALIRKYTALGYTVDIGLMQLNSAHLADFGLTAEDALDSCTNIRTAGSILVANYRRATLRFGEGQLSLLAALSAYNTGDFAHGFTNGYVSKYLSSHASSRVTLVATAHPTMPSPYMAETAVYSRVSVNISIQ